MSHIILIDEEALKECVESNVYQSPQFEIGSKLAQALAGDQTVDLISPRLVPHWKRNTLYLLQSRKETGYLAFDSCVFANLPEVTTKDHGQTDRLLVFQRVCRFAIKIWNRLALTNPTEKWLSDKNCGVVFPYPKSKHTGFRVSIRRGFEDHRLEARHGTKQLFAFAGGVDEANIKPTQEAAYKKAFQDLGSVRLSLDVQIKEIAKLPEDRGQRALVLNSTNHSAIKFQSYENWILRLTTEQKKFVFSAAELPQRVEGPAGTGKTLCLLLRAHFLCKNAEEHQTDCRVLFVSHSEATRDAIGIMLNAMAEPGYLRDRNKFSQVIELRTLQQWCGDLLGEQIIANSQFLDQDALEAKELRKDTIKSIVSDKIANEKGSLKFLSEKCRAFFQEESPDYIAELLQHEIGVMIKGRSFREALETYLGLPKLSYCLPTETDNDRRFVFSLYKEYQRLLNSNGVFDTDDIVLTALGRLDTPIWRRRRQTEGFDAIVIDETHLFNLNELSVFHFLVRDVQKPRIIFSIDRSQAPGERGITTRMVREALTGTTAVESEAKTKLIFRSAPEIVRLAEAITSAGAALFTTFENPLIDVSSLLLAADESLATTPVYWKCANDLVMCKWVAWRSKELSNGLKCPPNEIVVVAMDDGLLPVIRNTLQAEGRSYIEILHRGDLASVVKGEQTGSIILSHPDYLGGLEFKAVLLVGVDEGRVPPTEGSATEESLALSRI